MSMKRIDSGKRIRVYLMVGVVIQIISTALFFVSYFKMRESSKSNIMQFTDTHMTQLQKDFSENRIFIENELLSDPDTRLLFHKTGLEYVKAIGELQTYFRIAAQTNDNRYFFFVYDQKTERFIELTRVSIPFSAYRKIRPELTRVIRSGVQNGLWTLNDADGQRFVQSSWTYGDFTLGVWGYEKTLLENVSHLDYGKNGGASFVLKQAAEENKGPKFFKRTLTYDFSFSDIDADFSAEFTLDQHLFFRSLFWI